jgi:hypothetical protein
VARDVFDTLTVDLTVPAPSARSGLNRLFRARWALVFFVCDVS